jgi:RNA polymerase sigma factor (sigma-70 family)
MTIEQLFETNAEWAKAVMAKRGLRAGWPRSLRAEIENAALVGLWDAARRFRGCDNPSFRRYAYGCVYGAVVDQLRRNFDHGAPSCETTNNPERHQEPHFVSNIDTRDSCMAMIAGIPNCRLRSALTMYFLEGHTMQEIGDCLCVGKSRVSQMIREGIATARQVVAARRAISDKNVFRILTDALEPNLQMGDWVRAKAVKLQALAIGECVQIRLRGHTNSHLAVVQMASPDGEFWVFATPGQQERVYACEVAEVSRLERVAQ